MRALLAFACAALLVGGALAQDNVPKVFQGMKGGKGQYKVDILESPGQKGPRSMTICTDVLKEQGSGSGAQPDPKCKRRLLKDTANEAVMEFACPERTSTMTFKRESASSVLMEISSKGPKGASTVKSRYTHLGACKEGQGAMSFDRNSEQCQKIRDRAAKMDPEKACRRSKQDRDECIKKQDDTKKQMLAMCS